MKQYVVEKQGVELPKVKPNNIGHIPHLESFKL